MREVRDYNDAMRRYLAKKPFKFQWIDGGAPTVCRNTLTRDGAARAA